MIPIRDDNPSTGSAKAVYIIIGLNVAAWLFLQGFGTNPALLTSVLEYGLIPGELLGILDKGDVKVVGRGIDYTVGDPEWWTILTSMFMHGGWLHIIGNMWFLGIFGDNVENVMGSMKFGLFYVICGVAAAGAQIASAPGSPVPIVGASGAIGGVMGAYVVLFPKVPVHMLVFIGFFFFRIVIPAFLMIGYWFFIQFLGGFMSMSGEQGGVAFWAHIGGFITGAVLVKLFCNHSKVEECKKQKGRADRLFSRHRRSF